MLLRDKIAGFLMAFGAIGLAITPMLGGQTSSRTSAGHAAVTVAITTGPQLQLLQEGDKRPFAKQTAASRRDIVCKSVVSLIVADIGLQCRELQSTQNLALAKQ